MLWATYYGTGVEDFLSGVAIDSQMSIIVCGHTDSSIGLATPGVYDGVAGQKDILAKFDKDGSRIWATYYKRNGNPDADGGIEINKVGTVAVDKQNNIYFGGSQQIGLSAGDDVFISKWSSAGTFQWVTTFANSSTPNIFTQLGGLGVDTAGNPVICGATNDSSAIATPGAIQQSLAGLYDGYIAKFNSSGTLQWSTYFGGHQNDGFYGMAVDEFNNIYTCGSTRSASGVTTAGAYKTNYTAHFASAENDDAGCAWIVKFSPTGNVKWATYYGGDSSDQAYGITYRKGSGFYVTGSATSITGIASKNSFQDTLSGLTDAFLAKFDTSGSLIWGTYYGANNLDAGITVAVDSSGDPYVGGQTGSDNNIATSGAHQSVIGGYYDGFLVKFCGIDHPVLTPTRSSMCSSVSDTINLNKRYTTVRWYDGKTLLPDFNDLSQLITSDTLSTGLHKFSVVVTNLNGCADTSDTLNFLVRQSPVITGLKDTAICSGEKVFLFAIAAKGSAPYSYFWTPAAGLNNPATLDPVSTPLKTTTYYVFVTDSAGCQAEDSVTIHVSPVPVPNLRGLTSLCPQTDAQYVARGDSGDIYHWSLSGGGTLLLSSNADSVDVLWKTIGKWKLTVSRTNAQGCSADTTLTIDVNSTLTPVITPNGNITICAGDSITLHAENGYATYKWSDGTAADSLVVRQTGTYNVSVTDNNGCGGTSASVNVTVVPIPSVSIALDGPTHLCPGGVLHMTAVGDPGKYLWSNGDTAKTTTVTKAGTYTVQLTSVGGCSVVSLPVVVTVDSLFHPLISGPGSICQGEGPVNYSVPNNSGSVFTWMGTNGSVSAGQGSSTITLLWNDAQVGSGTLMVIETTSGGCQDTGILSITIDANLNPVITALGALSFCQGDSVMLDGGSGYTSYQWSKDGTSLAGVTGEFLHVGQSGSYSVQVTSSGGCSGSSRPAVVTVFPLPAQPVITQVGNSLVSSTSVSYQWFFNGQLLAGQTNQEITITADGKYAVTVTDGNGCSNSSAPFDVGTKATATVSVGPVPVVAPGNAVEIPIELVASQGLIQANANHYTGTLHYNGSMLIPAGSRSGILGSSSPISGSVDRKVKFQGSSAPMTSGTLQWIQANAVLGLDSCTTLVIDTFYWTDAEVDVIRESGSFCESDLCRAGGELRLIDATGKFGMSPIRPNPASAHILIEYDLIETGRTQITLVDLVGREIKVVSDEDQKPGHYQKDVPIGDMASGFYLSVLKSPSQLVRQPFIVHK